MKKKTVIIIAVLCVVCIAIGAVAAVVFHEIKKELYHEFSGIVDQKNPNSSIKTNAEYIGEDKAKDIALAKAGLSADEVRFDRVELDNDSGILHYEIEFRHGYTEYSIDVNALDGTVTDYEVDIFD